MVSGDQLSVVMIVCTAVGYLLTRLLRKKKRGNCCGGKGCGGRV